MTISLTHPFVSAKSDGGDATLVRPSNWNAEHTITMATARLLGRTTAATGAVEEITVGTGLTLSAGSLTASTTGGSTLIASGSLTGTAVSITNIPATYGELVLQITGASCDTATRALLIRVDTDNGASYDATAANYKGHYFDVTALVVSTLASLIESLTLAAAGTATATIILKGYQGGPNMRWEARFTDTTNGGEKQQFGTFIGSTSAINALQILWNGTGSFDAGTYALYGVS